MDTDKQQWDEQRSDALPRSAISIAVTRHGKVLLGAGTRGPFFQRRGGRSVSPNRTMPNVGTRHFQHPFMLTQNNRRYSSGVLNFFGPCLVPVHPVIFTNLTSWFNMEVTCNINGGSVEAVWRLGHARPRGSGNCSSPSTSQQFERQMKQGLYSQRLADVPREAIDRAEISLIRSRHEKAPWTIPTASVSRDKAVNLDASTGLTANSWSDRVMSDRLFRASQEPQAVWLRSFMDVLRSARSG